MEEAVAKHDPDPSSFQGLDPSTSQAKPAGASRRCRSPFASLTVVALLLIAFSGHAAAAASVWISAASPDNVARTQFQSTTHHDRQIDIHPSDGLSGPSMQFLDVLQNASHTAASQDGRLDMTTLDRLFNELQSARAQWTPTAITDSHGQGTLTKRAVAEAATNTCSCGEEGLSTGQKAAYGILVPILVLLSGLFAGLTLGYMSLDPTQLSVLAKQGTSEQKRYAEKIMPIREDGHLLLTTLLIANMITNETLPLILDPLLGGGLQSVVVSIVLVVIFAELIPQSVCSRYGLAIGAKMALVTRVVIFILWVIAYPVSRILHWTLGPHNGIIYRRAELKELVNMHAATGGHGDLDTDTVAIVGGALDLQEKVVKQAMTPIDKVFMIPLDAKLDYQTLQEIVGSGHSRIPVYHEIDIPVAKTRSGTATPSKAGGGGGFLSTLSRRTSSGTAVQPHSSAFTEDVKSPPKYGSATTGEGKSEATMTTIKKKKIIGALLVKSCILLDPEDAVPVREMVVNAVPTVPADEPLLNLLNVFQTGNSHLAIVSSRTHRGSPGSFLKLGNDDSPEGKAGGINRTGTTARVDDLGAIDEEKQLGASQIKGSRWSRHIRRALHRDAEEEIAPELADGSIDVSQVATEMAQRDVPIGIITLEDVLEELIGEEILDEYDSEVEHNFAKLSPPPSPDHKPSETSAATAEKVKKDDFVLPTPSIRSPVPRPSGGVLQRFKITRSNSTRDSPSYFDDVQRDSAAEDIPIAAGVPPDAKVETAAAAPVTRVRTFLDEPFTMSTDGQPPARPSSASAVIRRDTEVGGVPRTGKPVIIRHQPPGGPPATAIVSETLLRGRGITLDGQERSRSATPSGQTRGKVFKSSPIVAGVAAPPHRARRMSRDVSASRQGSLLAHQDEPATAPSTPVVDSRDEAEAEEVRGKKSSDTMAGETEKKDDD